MATTTTLKYTIIQCYPLIQELSPSLSEVIIFTSKITVHCQFDNHDINTLACQAQHISTSCAVYVYSGDANTITNESKSIGYWQQLMVNHDCLFVIFSMGGFVTFPSLVASCECHDVGYHLRQLFIQKLLYAKNEGAVAKLCNIDPSWRN